MKLTGRIMLLLLIWMACTSWGFFTHKLINKVAVFTLPTPINNFFKKHIYAITEMAVNADKRVYIDPNEGVRHYIDLDSISMPMDSVTLPWYKLKERNYRQQIMRKGIVPWQLERTYRKLYFAMKDKDFDQIIRHAADLGHYVADAHVPLHTSSNYNGQFTNQVGIHGLWETRLPEMFHKDYDLLVGKAEYISDVLALGWNAVEESNALVDSVLMMEKEISERIPARLHRAFVKRGFLLQNNFSDFYALQYHLALNGMVERRLRASIKAVGSLWFTAWVDAGQPNLSTPKLMKPLLPDIINIPQKVILGREDWYD